MRKKCHRRAREIKIPMTRDLCDQFAQELRFGLMAAKLGHLGKTNFDRIGAAFNVLWAAFYRHPPKDGSVLPVLEGAMRAMNQVAERGDATGKWILNTLEIATVAAAIERVESAMQMLTVNDLYRARCDVMDLAQ